MPIPELTLTACVCGIGLGAWVAVSGIFAELPVLVLTQPEGWKLASQLSLVVQIGNLGPLVYTIFHRLSTSGSSANLVMQSIRGCLVTATIACFLAIFFADVTSPTKHGRRSLALLILAFFASISDATTTVTYIPLLGLLSKVKATLPTLGSTLAQSMMIGEGLGGLLPVAVTWIQIPRPSSSHRLFGSDIFFLILTLQMVLAIACFQYIYRWWKRHHQASVSHNDLNSVNLHTSLLPSQLSEASLNLNGRGDRPDAPWYSMVTLAWLSFFMNGALPAVLGYAANRYSPGAYHTAQSLLLCANPVAAAIVGVHSVPSGSLFAAALLVATSLSIYLVVLASSNAQASWGSAGAVYAAVALASFLLAWVKTGLLTRLLAQQETSPSSSLEEEHKRSDTLFHAGVAIQIGSFVGALLFYILVNHSNTFE
eukprot:m.52254 g.52254  ORF g.52254 m.52254 type:complete len:426 (+) comp13493_c0_seq1:103-1380(+)